MICVVTCTESRPELFQLCKLYVTRQTVQPDLWLIKTATPGDLGDLPAYAKVVEGRSKEPLPNLAFALGHVPPEHDVVIMEDDDWYRNDHVEVMTTAFAEQPMTAAPHQVRYNVPARKWDQKHVDWGGPGQMALQASVLKDYIADLIPPDGGRPLWRKLGILPRCPTTSVGIKGVGYGLPGLEGTTKKHDPKSSFLKVWHPDPDGSKLREWIGADADLYFQLCK